MKSIAFGEILWDIIEGTPHLGGAPLNFAAHIAQCGADSMIISRVGTDNLGKGAVARIKEHRVNTDLIQIDEGHETGTVKVVLSNGQPDYTIRENVAYDFIEYNEAIRNVTTEPCDLFYFGSLAQRNPVSASTLNQILASNQFRDLFYDVNVRKESFNAEILNRSLKHCTILKLNADEVPVLSQLLFHDALAMELFCKQITERYAVRIVIITASEKGCYIFTNQHLSHVSGVQVEVADSVGAGDAFSAAFMYQYHKDKNAVKAATIANKIGAFVASQNGAIPKYSEEIRKLLKGKK